MKEKTKDLIKKFLKVVFGLLLIMAGVYGCIRWWPQLLSLILGAIGIIVILVGLMFVFIGFSD